MRRASRGAGRGARGRGALAVVVVVASVASWAWSARFYRRRMATGESDSHLGGRGQVEVAKRIRLEASAVKDFPVSFEFTLDIPGSQNRILAGF